MNDAKRIAELEARVKTLEARVPRFYGSISCYNRTKAFHFYNAKEFRKAVDLMYGDLWDVPYQLIDEHTLIMPSEAEPYFKNRGLRFKLLPVDSRLEARKKKQRRAKKRRLGKA